MLHRSHAVLLSLLLLLACSKSADPVNPAPVIEPSSNMVNVKDFGATGDGQTDDSKAFTSAMAVAHSSRKILFIPAGHFRADIVIPYDSLELTGAQQPDAELKTGTVILGKINANQKKHVYIHHLGIDSRGQLGPADDAALTSGITADSLPLFQVFSHITLLGDGYSRELKHGVLCFSGSDVVVKNIIVTQYYHGVAIRCSNAVVDSVDSRDCGFTAVVVKSAGGLNARAHNVLVDHITVSTDYKDVYSRGGAVMVSSYEAESITSDITVRHVFSNGAGVAAVLVEQHAGIIKDVTVSDCFSDGQGDVSSRACFDVDGGTNITLTNCTAYRSLGYGFRAMGNAKNVRAAGCYEESSGRAAWTGTFSYLQLNGIEIIK
jgi:hypothetical protein